MNQKEACEVDDFQQNMGKYYEELDESKRPSQVTPTHEEHGPAHNNEGTNCLNYEEPTTARGGGNGAVDTSGPAIGESGPVSEENKKVIVGGLAARGSA